MTRRLTGFSPLVRNTVNERSGRICEIQFYCTGDEATQHHHRRARGMGSTRRPETNQAANSLATCSSCHLFAETNRTDALSAGWLVSQHRTPADIPVLRRGVWVLLANDGNYQTIPTPAGGRVA